MRPPKYYKNILATCFHNHLSADEIFQSVKKSAPSIGKATVYRNIEYMSQKGLLRKLPSISGKMYYETVDIPHAHVIDGDGNFHDFPLQNIRISNMPPGSNIDEIRVTLKKI